MTATDAPTPTAAPATVRARARLVLAVVDWAVSPTGAPLTLAEPASTRALVPVLGMLTAREPATPAPTAEAPELASVTNVLGGAAARTLTAGAWTSAEPPSAAEGAEVAEP